MGSGTVTTDDHDSGPTPQNLPPAAPFSTIADGERLYARLVADYNAACALADRELTDARAQCKAVVTWLGDNAGRTLADYQDARDAGAHDIAASADRAGLVHDFLKASGHTTIAMLAGYHYGIPDSVWHTKAGDHELPPATIRASTICAHGGGNRDARLRQLRRETAALSVESLTYRYQHYIEGQAISKALIKAVTGKTATLARLAALRYDMRCAIAEERVDDIRPLARDIHAMGHDYLALALTAADNDGLPLLARAAQATTSSCADAILSPLLTREWPALLNRAASHTTHEKTAAKLRGMAERLFRKRESTMSYDEYYWGNNSRQRKQAFLEEKRRWHTQWHNFVYKP